MSKLKLICKSCGVSFNVFPFRGKKALYCSNKCKYSRKFVAWNKGLTKLTDKRVANYAETLSRKGIRPIQPKGYKHSKETKEKISKAQVGVPRYYQRGSKCKFWKGGITEKNLQIRNSLEYKIWRRKVFERDNYTCVWCKQRGGKLNADHIKPFSLSKALRFKISNGRTLCEDCHKKTDTYGYKIVKKMYEKNNTKGNS